MGRIRLYTGATGRLRFDSEAPDADYDRTNEGIAADYNAGVILRVDPEDGHAQCYYQARRGTGPEQMIAKYDGTAADADAGREPLTELEFGLQATLERLGWSVVEDAGGNQAVFQNLGRVSPREPTQVEESELRELVAAGERLDFGAPDPVAALEFVEYIRTGPLSDLDLSVAVCNNGRVPRLSDVDVVINPVSGVNEVRPIGGTDKTIRRRRTEAAAAAFADAIEAAGARLDRGPTESAAAAGELADTLNGAVFDRLDVRAVPRDETTSDRQRRLLAAVVGGVVGIAAVVAAAPLVTDLPSIVGRATQAAALTVPVWETRLIVVPSWYLLAGGGVLLAAAALPSIVPRLDRLPTPALARPDVGSLSTSTPPIHRAKEAFRELDGELSGLASHRSEDQVTLRRQSLATTLDRVGLSIEVDADRKRQRRRLLVVGVGVGAAAGVAVGGVLVSAYWTATQYWFGFLTALVIVAPLVAVGQAGARLYAAVGGLSAVTDRFGRPSGSASRTRAPPLGASSGLSVSPGLLLAAAALTAIVLAGVALVVWIRIGGSIPIPAPFGGG